MFAYLAIEAGNPEAAAAWYEIAGRISASPVIDCGRYDFLTPEIEVTWSDE
jgi:hypothetical protein